MKYHRSTLAPLDTGMGVSGQTSGQGFAVAAIATGVGCMVFARNAQIGRTFVAAGFARLGKTFVTVGGVKAGFLALQPAQEGHGTEAAHSAAKVQEPTQIQPEAITVFDPISKTLSSSWTRVCGIMSHLAHAGHLSCMLCFDMGKGLTQIWTCCLSLAWRLDSHVAQTFIPKTVQGLLSACWDALTSSAGQLPASLLRLAFALTKLAASSFAVLAITAVALGILIIPPSCVCGYVVERVSRLCERTVQPLQQSPSRHQQLADARRRRVAQQATAASAAALVHCTICTEDVACDTTVAVAGCGHRFCRGCLLYLIDYHQREGSTARCAWGGCTQVIPAPRQNAAQPHGPADAQANVHAAEAAFQQIARDNGWAICPGCGIVTERDGGCAHMTCRYCQRRGVDTQYDYHDARVR